MHFMVGEWWLLVKSFLFYVLEYGWTLGGLEHLGNRV